MISSIYFSILFFLICLSLVRADEELPRGERWVDLQPTQQTKEMWLFQLRDSQGRYWKEQQLNPSLSYTATLKITFKGTSKGFTISCTNISNFAAVVDQQSQHTFVHRGSVRNMYENTFSSHTKVGWPYWTKCGLLYTNAELVSVTLYLYVEASKTGTYSSDSVSSHSSSSSSYRSPASTDDSGSPPGSPLHATTRGDGSTTNTKTTGKTNRPSVMHADKATGFVVLFTVVGFIALGSLVTLICCCCCWKASRRDYTRVPMEETGQYQTLTTSRLMLPFRAFVHMKCGSLLCLIFTSPSEPNEPHPTQNV